MDFNLSDERRMLQETVQRFIRECYPIEKRHDITRSDKGYSPEMWAEFADLGLIGALLPSEVGGYGGTGEDVALVFEQLGRGLVVEPFLASGILGAWPLVMTDDTETLEAVIEGRHLLAFAHGEPGAGYTASHVRTRATEGADGWQLSGVKNLALNGDTAQTLIVSARVSGEADADTGLALFRVDPHQDGVACRSYALIDGGSAADITLGGAQGAPIGIPGEAFPMIEATLARAALAVSAEALGAMEVAKDLTLDYLKSRTQFGQPIGANQVLQHRMVDLLIEIEQVRSCLMLAASTLEADRLTRERNIAAAKHLTGRVGRQVAEEVIQMHGGVGMTWELALPHYAKRIVMIDHLFGDTDHHLEQFIQFSGDSA